MAHAAAASEVLLLDARSCGVRASSCGLAEGSLRAEARPSPLLAAAQAAAVRWRTPSPLWSCCCCCARVRRVGKQLRAR
jgi:hypothetical protein